MLALQQHGLHVAIIMHGNGRGVTRGGLLRVAGHRAGVAARRIAQNDFHRRQRRFGAIPDAVLTMAGGLR